MPQLTTLSKTYDLLRFLYLDRCGFRLLSADVIPPPNVFGIKEKSSAPILIATAIFQGVLEVTAPAPFVSTVQQGLGRGKSYGCGLLSLARIKT
ncbi:type I-E CRISPR-associated protein Cas6/Cse3/CasE [Leptothoe sp. PORK10 BA2]|uniref:type I-E CRISPR-associated protein Cas6/Cse3/CasE n=1 Tax=Leptothoe sp. PORK10 BA2 TaxID=3110254 RepID=UPI002B1F96F9|nr:type I-E CRISPR-associated protein Cas6/Cse3/CasE [Leptothoe sp. PORK10 BA2]MEA5463892.1 type I-E CRISPR-associated protein Cas6/Cse3/CasE [Leptothoe sp. PORK10 BA2]